MTPAPADEARARAVPSLQADASDSAAPSAAILHLCLLLSGLATALLGPILPLLSLRWHLSDQQSGLLLLAQFCGATTGGLTISKHLRRSLGLGLTAAAVGFTGFAFAPSLPLACVTLFAAGWGVGQLITASNIVAGRRYAVHRGSGLALLNFSFSLGAMLSPLLSAWLTPHFAVRNLLLGFAVCFAAALGLFAVDLRGHAAEDLSTTDAAAASASGLAFRSYLYFALLLFLYGGVETSLDGWLTTFALRFGGHGLAISQYTTLVLWASLTSGRALSSLLLLRVGEARLQRIGLIASSVCIAGLAAAHGALPIAMLSVLLGLSLSPFFPTTFALLMAGRPSARQAGVVLAMSGLGAAFLPSLMGVVSTHSGSLKIALVIPLAAAVSLLILSSYPQRNRASAQP
jgi:fucose permease